MECTLGSAVHGRMCDIDSSFIMHWMSHRHASELLANKYSPWLESIREFLEHIMALGGSPLCVLDDAPFAPKSPTDESRRSRRAAARALWDSAADESPLANVVSQLWCKKHPTVVMPADATHEYDCMTKLSKLGVLCPIHGPLKHVGKAPQFINGTCRLLTTEAGKAWLRAWSAGLVGGTGARPQTRRLPGFSESYHMAKQDARRGKSAAATQTRSERKRHCSELAAVAVSSVISSASLASGVEASASAATSARMPSSRSGVCGSFSDAQPCGYAAALHADILRCDGFCAGGQKPSQVFNGIPPLTAQTRLS